MMFVEEALNLQALFDDAIGRAQQQNPRPAQAAPLRQLTNENCPCAIEPHFQKQTEGIDECQDGCGTAEQFCHHWREEQQDKDWGKATHGQPPLEEYRSPGIQQQTIKPFRLALLWVSMGDSSSAHG